MKHMATMDETDGKEAMRSWNDESEEAFWLDLRDAGVLEQVSVGRAGGKAANLASLRRFGLPTPEAVVLTVDAWRYFLGRSGLSPAMKSALERFREDPEDFDGHARDIGRLVSEAEMPAALAQQIAAVYDELSREGSQPVAIRSSGTLEDSPEASFSGMLSSALGVTSREASLAAVRKCWSSGFGRRSLRYFHKMGFDPGGMGVAVIFQRMVRADISGVLFTVDPATGDEGVIVLEAAYGYGPGVVSGDVTPDLYRIDKQSLEISQWDSRPQEHYYDARGERRQVEAGQREEAKLSEEELCTLINYGLTAEKRLGAPQDMEWCRGPEGIVLLQTRPVTGLEKLSLSRGRATRPEIVMVRGIGVSPRVGWGEVRAVRPEEGPVPPTAEVRGKVVLVRRLTQDLAPRFREAAAVVADEGGSTSHGANILREFRVPCVVGTRYGLDVLHDGDVVTVDGWRGLVLDGIGPRVKESEFGSEQAVRTRTRLMTTINVPESAEKAADIADGVISFRNDYLLLQGGVHPGRLLAQGESKVLTDSVLEALLMVARAFRGKPVWYKSLDAPTDEFRRLRGGEDEPLERNPLLGWRGIARELEDPALLRAEYEAVRRAVADGCDSLGIKVPFVRDVSEYERAREIAVDVGLRPHEDVAFGASIETPAAVLTLDRLVDAGVDFFSVGINDLTMCCLGVDRESERVAGRFDPAHPAVVELLGEIIARAGDSVLVAAAGDIARFPDLMEQLVRLGYDAIGVSLPYLGTARAQVARWEEEQ